MNAAASDVLETRVASLERALRRTRWGMLGLLLLLIVLALVWYLGGVTQRAIRVHRLYAVDAAGTVRVRIGQDPPGMHRMSPVAGVTLYDRTGLERGGMATMDNGRVAIGLDASSTPPGTARDRVGMMVDGKGNTMFMLLDAQGAPVVMARGGAKGGTLQVSAMAADGKHLQVRTLGVHGDTQSVQDDD